MGKVGGIKPRLIRLRGVRRQKGQKQVMRRGGEKRKRKLKPANPYKKMLF